MITTDAKIESLIRKSFTDYYSMSNIDALKRRLMRFHLSGYHYKVIEVMKGDVNEVIQTVKSPGYVNPDQNDYLPFIKAEKLAAFRVLDFNAAAELAKIEKVLENPNPKTTRSQINLPAIELIMYYCVFIKGKDIFIYLDTNYKQFHWELENFFRTLKKNHKKENIK